jgi:hypothetical protein
MEPTDEQAEFIHDLNIWLRVNRYIEPPKDSSGVAGDELEHIRPSASLILN